MVLSLVGSLQRSILQANAKTLAQPNHYEPLMQLMRLSRFKHGAGPGHAASSNAQALQRYRCRGVRANNGRDSVEHGRDLHEGPPANAQGEGGQVPSHIRSLVLLRGGALAHATLRQQGAQ